jgi:hypothetical protein
LEVAFRDLDSDVLTQLSRFDIGRCLLRFGGNDASNCAAQIMDSLFDLRVIIEGYFRSSLSG